MSPLRRLLFFLAVLLAFTIGAHVIAGRMEGNLASLLVMWSPGAAALLVALSARRSLSGFGWRPGPVKWLGLGWALPLVYAVPAYGLIWVTGLGAVPSPTFLERARFTLGMAEASDALVIGAAFFYISLVNLLPNMVLVLGEEIGWRGFLVPELAQWGGFRAAALGSGAVWALWHLPGIFVGDYGAGDTPLLFRTTCFVIFVLTSGIVMAWLRIRAGSLWPAVLMHATHNGLIQAFFNRITADTGSTDYFVGEFGVAILPFSGLLAWYVWRRTRGPTPQRKSPRGETSSRSSAPSPTS